MNTDISRREFIKFAGIGLLGAPVLMRGLSGVIENALGPWQAVQPQRSPALPNWQFIVDIKKCIGCGQCVKACKVENDVPPEPQYNRTWIERYSIDSLEEARVESYVPNINFNGSQHLSNTHNGNITKSFFVPKLCNQCQRPPCVQVCPVGATYSTAEGIVLVNRKACVGCRYCIQACPYGARFLDPRLRVADKCTWCYHRIVRGLLPACVEVCPTGARVFGDLNDPESPLHKIIAAETLGVLKPDVGTEPKVYYIGLERGVR
ncbi:MAG: 4Fe-4S dicluster domain-containing protein [Chloroflexota bacterium]